MKRLLLFFFVCFALSSTAQAQALQSKACERPIAVCHFDKPVTQGDLLVAVSIGACLPVTGCNTVSDSQLNAWKTAIVLQYYNGQPLFYALDARGGYDTVYFAAGWAGIIAEYPPSTGLEGANDGYYGPQNLNPNGHPGSSDVGWARPIEAKESCELLIGWGNSGFYDLSQLHPPRLFPTAGPGFTIREHEYGWLVLEDMWTGVPGLYIASASWSDYGHFMFGGAMFKMASGCHK